MKLLFICTHNRCRSILAEAITNNISATRILAASAGSEPAGAVHPLSLKYLQEHGIDTQGLRSQSWDDFMDFSPDAVITLCDSAAAETCPAWFGDTVQVHWGLNDPSKINGDDDQLRAAFNNTTNIIEQRITCLLEHDLGHFTSMELRDALQNIAKTIN